jgi:AraC-like DNA-binding protein
VRHKLSRRKPRKTVSNLFQNRHRIVTPATYSFRDGKVSHNCNGPVSEQEVDWFYDKGQPTKLMSAKVLKIVNEIIKPDHLYAPHLAFREFSLSPGKEWMPKLSGWSLIQITSGNGYWLQEQSRTELEAGTVLLMAGGRQGRVLASQLNVLSLCYFSVMPERLAGLITHGELAFLNQAASQKDFAFQVLPAANPVALKMSKLSASRNQGGLASRLAMIQLWVEAWGKELSQDTPSPENTDATHRLRMFLKENPQDILLEISLDELAKLTNCTARHLSRIFYDIVGMSFRDKRAEIRLARARELLATSQSKVVEVALESGYKSLSLFNLMFTRHFGISPGRWRQKNQAIPIASNHRRKSRPGKPMINKARQMVVW